MRWVIRRTSNHNTKAPLATPKANGEVRDWARHKTSAATPASATPAASTATSIVRRRIVVNAIPMNANNAIAATGANELRL